RPTDLGRPEFREPPPDSRLRRLEWSSAAPDPALCVAVEGDLVAIGRLPRDASSEGVLVNREHRLIAEIRRVKPLGRIAGVQIAIHAGDVVLVPLEARRRIEPQHVLDDGAPTARVEVPGLLQAVRRPYAGVDPLLLQVAALPGFAYRCGKEGAGKPVAALAWDDVDAKATCEMLGLHRRVVDGH